MTNDRNWQMANMQERMEVIRAANLKAFPRKMAKAIEIPPDVMAIRLVVISSSRVVLNGF